MISLRLRSEQPELMDDLSCQGEVVDQTLRELDTINRLLGGNAVTIDGIDRLLQERSGNMKLTAADIGCGSGDMVRQMLKWSRTQGLDLQVTGFDANPNIIRFARENCQGIEGASFEVMNVLSDDYSKRKFDIVAATLFMHHLDNDALVSLLRTMKAQTRIGFVINDIHRQFVAYHAIRILTRLFSKSAMMKYDAPLSVRRAFKRRELEELLEAAGIEDYTLRWKWAFRWQVLVGIGDLSA